MIGRFQVPDPPDGWVYLDAIILIKCLDEEGRVRYKETRSQDLTAVEALGMTVTYQDTLREQIMKHARRSDD